ncbi:MAG: type II toxin-antitoxin system RelE/ParE family toxin [Roseiarcus sp.]
MRRLRVEFRASADADLLTIFEYVFDVSRSAETARRFTQRIRERCERIGNVPFGGRARDDLFPGLRTVPFEHSAVVAYTIEGECVWITNIFHGGRDYEALYRSEPTPDELD